MSRHALTLMLLMLPGLAAGDPGVPAALGRASVAAPGLAMGLNGVTDWTVAQPFVDVMKTARPWTGHLPGRWGGVEAARLEAAGDLDPAGWPRRIPAGLEALEALILTDLPATARIHAGRYRVTWEGRGDLSVTGRAQNAERRGGAIWFDYTPGPGAVGLRIAATDPGDPIRNIAVVRADRIALHDLGIVFNPDWLALIRDLQGLRFMDWMQTNGSDLVSWEARPRPEDYTWVRRGVPLEVMIDLANHVGADPWFTLPHRADDAHVTAFAQMVHDRLDPRLQVHAEWSNEIWNFIFPQTRWAADQARARWGVEGGEAWMEFAGMRAAQVADLWAGVFADAPGRLVRVVAVQTGWPGLEVPLLTAPRAVAEGAAPPWRSFDAYAVTGYFGHELGEAPGAPALLARGGDADHAAGLLRAGSLRDLLTRQWPYHAGVAKAHGLRLMMYEGGSHLVGHGTWVDDDRLTAILTEFSYSDQMAGLYGDLLAGWQALTDAPFNAFVEVAAPSKWGSWGARRDPGDQNPRAAMLDQWNASAGGPARAPGTFDAVIWHQGTAGDDRLTGRPWRADIVLAGAGDDVIQAFPGQRVDGGEGRDRLVLPGPASAWTARVTGAQLVLSGPFGTVLATRVEEVLAEDGNSLWPAD